MAALEQMLRQTACTVTVRRCHGRDARILGLLEEHEVAPEVDNPLHVPAAKIGIPRQEEERAVDTFLQQRLQ
jgi:hypothetical protein